MSNLTPLGDRLIVEPEAQETLTKAGIIIPESVKEKPQKGTVIAKGDGRLSIDGKRQSLNIEVGESILYSRYGGTEIVVDGKDLLVLRESDILAKVS